MFSNEFKKQLREQKWDKIQKSDSNPPQIWRRKKDQVNRAFEDINLLLKALPPEKQNEIITYQNIFPIITSVTKSYKRKEVLPDLRLVLDTVSHYLNYLIEIYSAKNEDSPNLSSLTIDHLERTRDICRDIINITINEHANTEGSNKGLIYIGKALNNRMIDDKKKFERFIRKILTNNNEAYATGLVDDTSVSTLWFDRYRFRSNRACSFTASVHDPQMSQDPDGPGLEIGKLHFDINPLTRKAEVKIIIGEAKITEELEVITKHGVHYFYASKRVAKRYENEL